MDVTVVTPSGTSATSAADQFTYELAPAVSALSPSVGPLAGATTVTITGTAFGGASGVSFGSSAAASYTVASATELTAMSPAESAGTVDVTVTSPSGTSTATPADEYTFRRTPSISTLSPTAGLPAGGTAVTITGTGFGGASAVDFGGVAAHHNRLHGHLHHRHLAGRGGRHGRRHRDHPGGHQRHLGCRPVHLRGGAGRELAQPGGRPQLGRHLGHHYRHQLAGASRSTSAPPPATSYIVSSATELTAVSPAGTGTVDVTVANPVGTSTATPADEFTYGPPRP